AWHGKGACGGRVGIWWRRNLQDSERAEEPPTVFGSQNKSASARRKAGPILFRGYGSRVAGMRARRISSRFHGKRRKIVLVALVQERRDRPVEHGTDRALRGLFH